MLVMIEIQGPSMSNYDPDRPSKKPDETWDDEDTGSGQGGKSGQIEFRDFTGMGERARDDLLSPEETRRLLAVHQAINEGAVKKQKDLRAQRTQVQEKKISLSQYREGKGMGSGSVSQYKTHPHLQKFNGADPKVSMVPTEQVVETNPELRNKLEHQLRYQPSPSTPRLTKNR